MIISATIPMPPAANNLFRNVQGRGRVRSDGYKAWAKSAGYLLNIAKAGKQIDGAYALHLSVGKPDNRKRDLGNLEKAVSDLLVDCGAVVDDSDCQRIRMEWTDEHDDVFLRVIPTKEVPARNHRPAAARKRAAA